MLSGPQNMTDEARAARERVRQQTRVGKLERGLTPSQWGAYRRWLDACGRMDVPVTTETRFEFLSDLKEDVTSR